MITPEQARKLAAWEENNENLPAKVRDALRDLAQQVEELQAQVAELQTELTQANTAYVELLQSAEGGYW